MSDELKQQFIESFMNRVELVDKDGDIIQLMVVPDGTLMIGVVNEARTDAASVTLDLEQLTVVKKAIDEFLAGAK